MHSNSTIGWVGGWLVDAADCSNASSIGFIALDETKVPSTHSFICDLSSELLLSSFSASRSCLIRQRCIHCNALAKPTDPPLTLGRVRMGHRWMFYAVYVYLPQNSTTPVLLLHFQWPSIVQCGRWLFVGITTTSAAQLRQCYLLARVNAVELYLKVVPLYLFVPPVFATEGIRTCPW